MAKIDKELLEAEHIVKTEVDKICRPLDEYVDFVVNLLRSGSEITNSELEYMALDLSTQLYYVAKQVELIGIREDIAEFIKNDNYDIAFSTTQGTVADKTASGRLNSQEEALIKLHYKRCYKAINQRLERGEKILDAVKKAMSRRMAELDLSRKDMR